MKKTRSDATSAVTARWQTIVDTYDAVNSAVKADQTGEGTGLCLQWGRNEGLWVLANKLEIPFLAAAMLDGMVKVQHVREVLDMAPAEREAMLAAVDDETSEKEKADDAA